MSEKMNHLPCIISTLERLLAGELDARTGLPPGGDEAGRLAQTVDALAESIQARHRHIEQITGRARRIDRGLHTLSASNRALLRAASEAAQLQEVCRLSVEVGGYVFAWAGYAEKDEGKTIRPAAFFGAGQDYFAGLRLTWEDSEFGRGPAGVAVREGCPAVCHDVTADSAFAPWREAALAHGFHSVICLPLRLSGEVAGVLCIYAAESGVFDRDEIELLGETADDLAFAVETLRTREREKQASRRNQLILASAGEGIFGTDADGAITFVNAAALDILGYREDELLGRNCHAMLHHSKADGSPNPHEGCPMYQTLTAGLVIRGQEETFWRKDGTPSPVEFTAMPIRDGEEITGMVVTLTDIRERKRYLAQLERHSNYDDLTGLPNRNLARDRLAQLAERRRREGKEALALMLNLDRFKEINDGLGRAAGDQALREAAARLKALESGMDTAARIGDDEFLLLAEIGGADEAADLARRVRETFAAPLCIGGKEVFLTVSIGLGLFPRDGADGETLLKNATAAMHRAKAAGGNDFRFYAAAMNDRQAERLRLESDLYRALERGELLLHYQPQLSLRSGEIIGSEALLRWRHPERGLVSPADFIPLAEETGLILPIGEWVLRAACAQNQAWQEAGLPAVTVAVNLSARQFKGCDVAELAARVLDETGLDPAYLELELTESAAMDDAEGFIQTTEKLKALKLALSIDDFGTGYSSLNHPKRFSLDRLKIDQSFIRDIASDPDDAAIVRAAVALAHGLKLSVIAEGVETEAQMNFLRLRGCDEMQGYYFSKPLPASEFAQLLGERRKLAFAPEAELPERILLLVDDETAILSSLKRLLRREGYRIVTAASGAEGLERLAEHEAGVVVSDARMPQMSGAEFLGRVRELHPATVRIMLTGYTELRAVTEAVNRGELFKFLAKPWDDGELLETLREAFRHYEARRACRELEL